MDSCSLWFLMVPYGSLQFLMVPYGSLWFLMVFYGVLWFLRVPQVSLRYPNFPKGSLEFLRVPWVLQSTLVFLRVLQDSIRFLRITWALQCLRASSLLTLVFIEFLGSLVFLTFLRVHQCFLLRALKGTLAACLEVPWVSLITVELLSNCLPGMMD